MTAGRPTRADLADALLRYAFARNNLFAVDRAIRVDELKAGASFGNPLAQTAYDEIADLLREQADLSVKFADAALALCTALQSDTSHTTTDL